MLCYDILFFSFIECGCSGNATCEACDSITGECECMPGYYGRACDEGKCLQLSKIQI